MLAIVRADSVNFPLFVHVAGSMLLVGTLIAAVAALVLARSDGGGLQRLSFRTMLWGAIPTFIVMRGGAEWVKSEEHAPDDATWIGIGYGVSDLGLLLLIVATVLAGLTLRRANRGGRPGALAGVSAAIVSLMLLGYGIAIWAMTTKPD